MCVGKTYANAQITFDKRTCCHLIIIIMAGARNLRQSSLQLPDKRGEITEAHDNLARLSASNAHLHAYASVCVCVCVCVCLRVRQRGHCIVYKVGSGPKLMSSFSLPWHIRARNCLGPRRIYKSNNAVSTWPFWRTSWPKFCKRKILRKTKLILPLKICPNIDR